MFNKKEWAEITEKTYGYEAKKYQDGNLIFYYSHTTNVLGDYYVAPPFGDYIWVDPGHWSAIGRFARFNGRIPLKLKICAEQIPMLPDFSIKNDGFIHRIKFRSYEEWYSEKIQYDFRRMIKQAINRGVEVTVHTDYASLMEFWNMHAKLRIEKFGEIPQPRLFFKNIFDEYFLNDSGYLFFARNEQGHAIGAVLLIIDGEAGYYKFNASNAESLRLRPNNLLIDRIVRFLVEREVNVLDMGFTGNTDSYYGLRQFKQHAGACERPRYTVKNKEYDTLNLVELDKLKKNVTMLLQTAATVEQLESFSTIHYGTFI